MDSRDSPPDSRQHNIISGTQLERQTKRNETRVASDTGMISPQEIIRNWMHSTGCQGNLASLLEILIETFLCMYIYIDIYYPLCSGNDVNRGRSLKGSRITKDAQRST